MQKKKRQGYRSVTMLLLTAFLFLAGCSGRPEAAAAGTEHTENQAAAAEESAGSGQTLKILSVEYRPLIASAAGRYGELHPDVEVVYESILGEGSGGERIPEAAAEAYERLCAGEAADVLILNEFPVDRLIREGQLEELSGVLETVLNDDNYYTEVIGGYRTEQGLFAAVTDFVPVVACLREGVPEEILTLDGLYRYLTEHEDRTGFVPYRQKNQLGKVLYQFYGGELLQEGEVNREALTRYLQTWKLLKDRADAADGWKLDKMAGTIDELACLAETGQGDICFLKEVGVIAAPTARRTEGIRTVSGRKNLGGSVVGVWREAGQKEQALDFVRFLFTQFLPEEGGMTVYKDRPGLEEEAALEQDKQGDHFTVGRESFVRYSLREEDIDWLFEIYGKCAEPVPGLQDVVYEILKEYSVDYLEGKQELEQAVDQILKAILAAG